MEDTLEGLAGTMPDARVAERLGIEVEAVKAWRCDHGIAPYLQMPPGPGRREIVATGNDVTEAPRRREVVRRRANGDSAGSLREVPSRQTAPAASKRPDPPRRSSASARLDPLRDRLGTVPDHVIAAEAGVSQGVVGAYRRKHGIRAYEGYLFQPGHAPLARTSKPREPKRREPKRREPKRTAPAAEPPKPRSRFVHLGESDPRAAELTGVGRIARSPDGEVPRDARSPGPRVRSASPRGLRAFTVVASANGTRREFVAVGEDMFEACRKAEACLADRADGPWLVDQVGVLGEALG